MLQRISNRPHLAEVTSTIPAQSASTDTSPFSEMASPPAFRIISVVSSAAAASKSATPTFAPSLASTRALAFPMPAPAPVTNATLSLTRMRSPANPLQQKGEPKRGLPVVVIAIGLQVAHTYGQEKR